MWAHGTPYCTVVRFPIIFGSTREHGRKLWVNEQMRQVGEGERGAERGENRFRFGLACTNVQTAWCVGRFKRIFLLCHSCILYEFLYTLEMVACMCAPDMFRFVLFVFVYSLTTWFSPPLWFGPFTAFRWWWVHESVYGGWLACARTTIAITHTPHSRCCCCFLKYLFLCLVIAIDLCGSHTAIAHHQHDLHHFDFIRLCLSLCVHICSLARVLLIYTNIFASIGSVPMEISVCKIEYKTHARFHFIYVILGL